MKPTATYHQVLETGAPPRPASKTADLDALATLTDSAFRIPGLNIRFGIDSIIGLIPGLGDFITTLMSLYVLAAGVRYGVPRATLARMGINVAIDAVVGAIPLLGDVFDVFWKANMKNVALIRRHVNAPLHDRGQFQRRDRTFLAISAAVLLAFLAAVGYVGYLAVRWLVQSL